MAKAKTVKGRLGDINEIIFARKGTNINDGFSHQHANELVKVAVELKGILAALTDEERAFCEEEGLTKHFNEFLDVFEQVKATDPELVAFALSGDSKVKQNDAGKANILRRLEAIESEIDGLGFSEKHPLISAETRETFIRLADETKGLLAGIPESERDNLSSVNFFKLKRFVASVERGLEAHPEFQHLALKGEAREKFEAEKFKNNLTRILMVAGVTQDVVPAAGTPERGLHDAQVLEVVMRAEQIVGLPTVAEQDAALEVLGLTREQVRGAHGDLLKSEMPKPRMDRLEQLDALVSGEPVEIDDEKDRATV